jgi:WD40 repeat protein
MKKAIFLLLSVVLFAAQMKKITLNGYISKITYNNKYLIAALESGEVVIKDFNSLKDIDKITLPKIHDFMGDIISMPVYSLDISDDNKNLLILAEGENAKREFFIYNFKTKKLTHIFTTKDTLMKASFLGNDKVFFALLSDEAMLYDLKTKKSIYKTQIGNYVFSTYAIDKKRKLAVFGDESGALKLINLKNGKKIREIKGFNKDKTISADLHKDLVINGSADMRIGIYSLNGALKTSLKVKFLPYGTTLSPDNTKFATQYDEKNNIAIYSIYGKLIDKLKAHTMTLNGIKFLNNNTIISYSPAEIIIWKLK